MCDTKKKKSGQDNRLTGKCPECGKKKCSCKSGQDRSIATGRGSKGVANRQKLLSTLRSGTSVTKRFPRLSKAAGAKNVLGYIHHPSFGNAAMVNMGIRSRHKPPESMKVLGHASTGKVKARKKSGQDCAMTGKKKKSGQDSAMLGQHGKPGGHCGYGV